MKTIIRKPVEDVVGFVNGGGNGVCVANGEKRSETCEYALTPAWMTCGRSCRVAAGAMHRPSVGGLDLAGGH